MMRSPPNVTKTNAKLALGVDNERDAKPNGDVARACDQLADDAQVDPEVNQRDRIIDPTRKRHPPNARHARLSYDGGCRSHNTVLYEKVASCAIYRRPRSEVSRAALRILRRPRVEPLFAI